MRPGSVLFAAAVLTLVLAACTGPAARPSNPPSSMAAGMSDATTPVGQPSTTRTSSDATSGSGSSATTRAATPETSGTTSDSSGGTENDSGGLSSSVDTGTSNVQSSVEVRVAEIISDYGGQVTNRGTALTIPGAVLFDTDQDTLRRSARRDLDKVVEVLDFYPGVPVEVVGHTDSRSSDAYNQDLSERRAKSVADYLRGAGVDGSRLAVSGRGESEPVAANDTAQGRQRNRRVVVTVVGVAPPDAPSEAATEPGSTAPTEPSTPTPSGVSLPEDGFTFTRTGGIAGVTEELVVRPDGTSTLRRGDGSSEATLEPGQLAALGAALDELDWTELEDAASGTSADDDYHFTISGEDRTVQVASSRLPRPAPDLFAVAQELLE